MFAIDGPVHVELFVNANKSGCEQIWKGLQRKSRIGSASYGNSGTLIQELPDGYVMQICIKFLH